MARKILGEELMVDVVTREHDATDYTWTCNVLVVTPGVALNWFKSGQLGASDLMVYDEVHQTSEHLELSLALAKRAGCTAVFMSATVDPQVYSDYFGSRQVIACSAFDPSKKSVVFTESPPRVDRDYDHLEDYLTRHMHKWIEQKRAVAVFVPTRAKAEKLSGIFGEWKGLYADFYHGGESADKLRAFLTGSVPQPFIIFMTIAGASSLNILGLNTVVIQDDMYAERVRSGVSVLERVELGNNELLQMGGRVNGR
ncbi:MAG: DEAD/DEAH box helicase, partial [Patescibacteria group bacterium]